MVSIFIHPGNYIIINTHDVFLDSVLNESVKIHEDIACTKRDLEGAKLLLL